MITVVIHHYFIDVKADQARHIDIPQYDTLTTEKIYNYLSSFPDVFKFFPDNREMVKLPKERKNDNIEW